MGRSNVEAYSVALEPSDRQWLKQHGPFCVWVSPHPDYGPFEMTVNGQDFEGLTADYAQLLSQLLRTDIVVKR